MKKDKLEDLDKLQLNLDAEEEQNNQEIRYNNKMIPMPNIPK